MLAVRQRLGFADMDINREAPGQDVALTVLSAERDVTMKRLRLLVILVIVLLVPPLSSISGEGSYTVFLPAVAREYKNPKRDDFDGPSLDPMWSWDMEDPESWSLTARPGFLRILSHPGGPTAENLLLVEAPKGDYVVTTRVLFTPTSNFQFAGLVLGMQDDTYLAFGRAFCDLGAPLCVGNGIYFDHMEGGALIGDNFSTPTTNQGEAYLGVRRQDDAYYAFYSEDGATWTLIGTHTPSPGVDLWVIGVSTWNDLADLGIPADFDFVEIRTGS